MVRCNLYKLTLRVRDSLFIIHSLKKSAFKDHPGLVNDQLAQRFELHVEDYA